MKWQNEIQNGRIATQIPANHFLQNSAETFIDHWEIKVDKTVFKIENAKSIINKVPSPDFPMWYSLQPYDGTEQGCTYCQNPNSHEFYGFNAGIDFKKEILVKYNAPALFRKHLQQKSWKPQVISLSGNMDCYQIAEKRFKITRRMLEIALEFRQPIGIVTKNNLIIRDIDLLQELAQLDLCCVYVSISTFSERLRQKLEPGSLSGKQRLKILEALRIAGIPVGVLVAPIIPGLNSGEAPAILKASSHVGATNASYTIIRLNRSLELAFQKWLALYFPNKFEKVWKRVKNGQLRASYPTKFNQVMPGSGEDAQIINYMFNYQCNIWALNERSIFLDTSQFKVPDSI